MDYNITIRKTEEKCVVMYESMGLEIVCEDVDEEKARDKLCKILDEVREYAEEIIENR